MDCLITDTAITYILVGFAYASVKHYAMWEYYKKRTLWTKFHHYWFEACFWPMDLARHVIVTVFR